MLHNWHLALQCFEQKHYYHPADPAVLKLAVLGLVPRSVPHPAAYKDEIALVSENFGLESTQFYLAQEHSALNLEARTSETPDMPADSAA